MDFKEINQIDKDTQSALNELISNSDPTKSKFGELLQYYLETTEQEKLEFTLLDLAFDLFCVAEQVSKEIKQISKDNAKLRAKNKSLKAFLKGYQASQRPTAKI